MNVKTDSESTQPSDESSKPPVRRIARVGLWSFFVWLFLLAFLPLAAYVDSLSTFAISIPDAIFIVLACLFVGSQVLAGVSGLILGFQKDRPVIAILALVISLFFLPIGFFLALAAEDRSTKRVGDKYARWDPKDVARFLQTIESILASNDARWQDQEQVRDILSLHGIADIDRFFSNGLSPLMVLAEKGNIPALKLFLTAGVNRTQRTMSGFTAADLARNAGHGAVAELIDSY